MASEERIFVGRAAELRVLVEHITDLHEDEQRFVLIDGLPGIGKRTLIHHALREIPPGQTITVSCSPADEQVPGAVARRLLALLGEDTDALEPHALHTALVKRLEQRPLECLVMEDVHWMDAHSADIVLALASARRFARVMVATVRTGHRDYIDHLSRLGAGGEGLHLTLYPFNRGEVNDLLNSYMRANVPAALAEQVRKGTDGIPLHCCTVARWLDSAPAHSRNFADAFARLDEYRDGAIVEFDRSIGSLVNSAPPAVRAALGLLAASESPATVTELEASLSALGHEPEGAMASLDTGLVTGLRTVCASPSNTG